MANPERELRAALTEARACTACVPNLPLGPRPLVRAEVSARLLIVSQAPGTKAHDTDLSFNDPSGDRLRGWMGMDRDTFYDRARVAILPMGFCYPGRLPRGGDKPPRLECAPLWHARIMAALPEVALTLYVGSYAIRNYLPGYKSMTDAVANWRSHTPAVLPLPHLELAHDGMGKETPVVPRRAAAGAAGAGGGGAVRLAARTGLDLFHFVVGKAEVVTDFMDQYMADKAVEVLTGLAPVIEDRSTIKIDPVQICRLVTD